MASLLLSLLLLAVCLLLCCSVRLSLATVYTVGGHAGWTTPTRAKVNYSDWAANTPFKVGDTLEFNYVQKAHSVLEVTRSDFRYCNRSNPLATYEDGKTAVELAKAGNYYFMDGVAQHCEEGQKFQAKVQASPSGSISSSPSSGAFAPAVAPSSSSSSSAETPTPTPTPAAIPPATAWAPPPPPSSSSFVPLLFSLVLALLAST